MRKNITTVVIINLSINKSSDREITQFKVNNYLSNCCTCQVFNMSTTDTTNPEMLINQVSYDEVNITFNSI